MIHCGCERLHGCQCSAVTRGLWCCTFSQRLGGRVAALHPTRHPNRQAPSVLVLMYPLSAATHLLCPRAAMTRQTRRGNRMHRQRHACAAVAAQTSRHRFCLLGAGISVSRQGRCGFTLQPLAARTCVMAHACGSMCWRCCDTLSAMTKHMYLCAACEGGGAGRVDIWRAMACLDI